MPIWILLLLIAALGAGGFLAARSRALATVEGAAHRLHSLPGYYGAYGLLWTITPPLIVMSLWLIAQSSIIHMLVMAALPAGVDALPADRIGLLWDEIENAAAGGRVFPNPDPLIVEARDTGAEALNSLRTNSNLLMTLAVLAIAIGALLYGRRTIHAALRARNAVEHYLMVALIACSAIAIITTIGIIFSLVFEASRFFERYPFLDFLFGLTWSTQSDTFGAIPLFAGTILITIIALLVAVPVGLMAAIYLSEYVSRKGRGVIKPMLEILAGIPTVVYGFFALLTVAPLFRDIGLWMNISVDAQSALAAGVVMGIMIIPFVSSLSDDVINAVPQSLRDGAYGLGATRSECIKNVVLPAALPGIFAAILLAASRAIGETMIVAMAAGLAANLTFNPLDAVTTVTVQIVKLLEGDQAFDSTMTLSLFALGLLLFVVTLSMNFAALRVVQKYREKYD